MLFSLSTSLLLFRIFFFFNDTAPPEIYTLSLHDALPIWPWSGRAVLERCSAGRGSGLPAAHRCSGQRSEEHTSELQSRPHLVCRLLLEKKKKKKISRPRTPSTLLPYLRDRRSSTVCYTRA